MVCIKPIPNGSRIVFWTIKVTRVARIITKVTAPVIPKAVETFLDTPRNGQIPKNCASTMLLTKTAAINIKIYSIIRLFLIYDFSFAIEMKQES